MKIVITGGGSGGHFYPMIAVVDKLRKVSEDQKMLQPEIFYFATEPYNEDILLKNRIKFSKIYAGKLRKYFSFLNIIDFFKMGWGIFHAFIKLFQVMPNVIFTNGGYVAFPVLVVARILKIPVVIHVSDTVPSRVLLFAGKFAEKVSISFSEAAKYFDPEKVAYLGNPIRERIKKPQTDGAYSFLGLQKDIPIIWILGGSQGSALINDIILEALPELVKKYQIIHQTGKNFFNEIYGRSGVILLNNKYKSRYRIYPYLDDLAIKMCAGISNLIISRAGAGSINEIAAWGIPAILIPISEKVSRDQESNAFSYARNGGAVVIRQKNLSDNLLLSEIMRIMDKPELHQQMSNDAKDFFKPDADVYIAKAILKIIMEHES